MYSSVSDSHLGICQLERANKQGILMYSYLIGGVFNLLILLQLLHVTAMKMRLL